MTLSPPALRVESHLQAGACPPGLPGTDAAALNAVTTPQPPPGAPPQPFPHSPPEYPDNVPPEIEEPEVPGEHPPVRDPQGPPPEIINLH